MRSLPRSTYWKKKIIFQFTVETVENVNNEISLEYMIRYLYDFEIYQLALQRQDELT